ncbi:MAG: hypothetical protein ACOC40_02590 [Thermoplasmatota archaeon]
MNVTELRKTLERLEDDGKGHYRVYDSQYFYEIDQVHVGLIVEHEHPILGKTVVGFDEGKEGEIIRKVCDAIRLE